MTFFFDRCTGTQIPQALQVFTRLPVEIRYHQEVFGVAETDQALPDDACMSAVAQRGWITITQDYRFHRVPAIREAVRQHGAGVFYVWGAQAAAWETTRSFLWTLPRILDRARTASPPYVYRVRKDLSIHGVNLG